MNEVVTVIVRETGEPSWSCGYEEITESYYAYVDTSALGVDLVEACRGVLRIYQVDSRDLTLKDPSRGDIVDMLEKKWSVQNRMLLCVIMLVEKCMGGIDSRHFRSFDENVVTQADEECVRDTLRPGDVVIGTLIIHEERFFS